MHELILWCGFAGSWLLVAGPIYQAAIELREEELETDRLRELITQVPQPPPVSSWWWLLPPVRYLLERRRTGYVREQVLARMSEDDYDALQSYVSKARGWSIVAGGAFLLAVAETYDLAHDLEWPLAVFWALVALLPFVCFSFTRWRIVRSEEARAQRFGTAGA